MSKVPRRMRDVAMAAAPSVTHASVPHSVSQVNTPSHPCCSPRAASSVNSSASANGTTNPNLIPGRLAIPTDRAGALDITSPQGVRVQSRQTCASMTTSVVNEFAM